MAAIKTYVRFRDTHDPDDLCPKCFNPGLKRFILQEMSMDGITNLGERIACTDCRIWTGPLEEYAHHD
jgi:hypothetical protein